MRYSEVATAQPQPYESFTWPPASYAEAAACEEQYNIWEGTVAQATNELTQMVNDGELNNTAIWHPSRIAGAIIRQSERTGQQTERLAALTHMASFTKDLFMGRATVEQVEQVTGLTSQLGDPNFMRAKQTLDIGTLRATNTERASEAASRLVERDTGHIFMVPLCQGGFTAGVLTALEYERQHGSTVDLYPIRYSSQKERDGKPLITRQEIKHIATKALLKTIVVVDEDTASGHTISTVVHRLRQDIQGSQIIGLACHDGRTKRDIDIQDRWWQPPMAAHKRRLYGR